MPEAFTHERAGGERTRAPEALALIYCQHAELRGLLRVSLDIARRATEGQPLACTVLPRVLGQIRALLERHLETEEALLLPIMMDDLPLGPVRARAFEEEHARQRAEIERLTAATAADEPRALADNLRHLVRDFLIDMAEEEEVLLRDDVIRDDLVVIDQDCG